MFYYRCFFVLDLFSYIEVEDDGGTCSGDNGEISFFYIGRY